MLNAAKGEMLKRRRRVVFGVFTLAVSAFGIQHLALTAAPQATRYEFSSRLMGTEGRVVLYGSSHTAAREAADRAFARIAALDAVMSDYQDDSELMVLCQHAGTGPIRVSDDLFRVLEASQQLARDSHGAFDVTAAPLIHLWRRARRVSRLPAPTEIAAAKTLTGTAKMILNARDRSVDLRAAKMQIDLGGIGKGFAADEAVKVLTRLGYGNALVALGGDIVAAGAPPGQPGWTIDVATLRLTGTAGPQVVLRDAAVSTSGDAEQWVEIGGTRYSHIIDPRSGAALTGRRSVTVIAPSGTLSDGLATAVSVLGPVDGLALVARTRGAAVSMSIAGEAGIRTVRSPNWRYFAAGGSGPISTRRNSTSEPSACSAIRPRSAVQLKPSFTRSPFTHTLIPRSRASTISVFHWPSGFSEPSVRLRMRRASPSLPPHFSPSLRGRRRSMSATSMFSLMHQKSPAFSCIICTSIDCGNIL
jgi:thiamine biosynthesis lipoprotein